MSKISVVIITLNEEKNIIDCIRSAKLLSDDIIVVDSGSVDHTVQLARHEGARVFPIKWQGYGFSRNLGAGKAKHNWIFALDADERISPELATIIAQWQFTDRNQVLAFKRKNFLGQQPIRFGTLGFESVTRVYNRHFFSWDLTLVHERLTGIGLTKKYIKGQLIHFGLKSFEDQKIKAVLYAQMSAEKYFTEGRKVSPAKKYLSPFFNSIKSYIFQLGFLEGRQGWEIARNIAYYSWLKYFYLQQLGSEVQKIQIPFSETRKIETISN